MNEKTTQTSIDMDMVYEKIQGLRDNINKVLIGQDAVVDQVIISLLSNGHVLVEGVPGLGKTLLIRALAVCFMGEFKRIQFTPDLMPADITGHTLYNMNEGKFHLRKGPIFTNLLLADEINRSPAKTQAALLEVMQERQVTIEGNACAIPKPFMVLATQNPIEQEGTYPLPEAEVDRFLMKIFIDFPDFDSEVELTNQVCNGITNDPLNAHAQKQILNAEELIGIQNTLPRIVVDEQIFKYAVRLVRSTRESSAIIQGAGPRACIALIRCARACALLQKRNFVLPDDIKAMALPVMRHRISLSADVEIDGLTADDILSNILETVEAPRL